MKSRWFRFAKDESGQVLVLFALLLTVIFGFTALAVDVGGMVVEKSHLQNAADAAALAGAQDLPNSLAFSTAKDYAKENGVPKEKTVAKYYQDDEGNIDTNKIFVECEVDYDFTFARVFEGFTPKTISASAIAQKKSKWEGEALPFINLAFDYLSEDPFAWTHIGEGIKGTIMDFFTRNADTDDPYYEIDYTDGITVTPGYGNPNGIDESKLRVALEKVLTPSDKGVKKVYLFSLSSKVIQSGQFTVNNEKKTVYLDKLNKLDNGDVIDPDQLVLIECLFLDCKWSNQTEIELEFLGNVFDLGNDDPANPLPDFPTENLSTGGSSRLIQ